MKKIIGILMVLVVLSPIVLAQSMNQSERERAAAEVGQQLAEQMRYEIRRQSAQGIRQLVIERANELDQQIEDLPSPLKERKKAFQNQNGVRLAVYALLEMENITGGIGPQIRDIARNFDNSVLKTITAEERIEKRGGIKRFFAGGDFENADILDEQVAENRKRIKKLKQLRDQCQCPEDIKVLMTEKIQEMEKEQNRLQGLSKTEKSRKGIVGWIWK